MPESVGKPDYPTAAAAWMSNQMTMAMMRYDREVVRIAYEYGQRLTAELAADEGGETGESQFPRPKMQEIGHSDKGAVG